MSVIQPGSVNTHTHTHTERERERETKHAFHSPSHAHVCVRTSSPAQYFTHTYLSVRIGARKPDIFFSVSFSFLHYSLRFFLSLSFLSLTSQRRGSSLSFPRCRTSGSSLTPNASRALGVHLLLCHPVFSPHASFSLFCTVYLLLSTI